MERKIHAESLEWKDDPDRKPMILLGCRQVGKIFIVMEFGDREYENIAYNQHYIERILNNPKTPKCNREAAIKFVKDHPDYFIPRPTDTPLEDLNRHNSIINGDNPDRKFISRFI